MDVVVAALGDHPEFIPVVAGWHWREWGHTDLAGPLESWTAGLAARRHGHGELLVRRCQAWASSLGFDALHLYTERSSAAQALYERMDWQVIRQAHYEGIDATVMRTFRWRPAARARA
jgi:hypothetical protein